MWPAFHRWCRLALVALAILHAGCGGQSLEPASQKASADSLSTLHPLDKATSAEFRRAFDEGKNRTRFIVALSPT
jgi:hypothetical protein